MRLCDDMRPVFRAHRENLLLTPGKRHAEKKEGDGLQVSIGVAVREVGKIKCAESQSEGEVYRLF